MTNTKDQDCYYIMLIFKQPVMKMDILYAWLKWLEKEFQAQDALFLLLIQNNAATLWLRGKLTHTIHLDNIQHSGKKIYIMNTVNFNSVFLGMSVSDPALTQAKMS